MDFVAIKNNFPSYYQVAYLMGIEETRNREFASLKEINDNYPKYILTMDSVDFSKDGIIHLNIKDFLLSE